MTRFNSSAPAPDSNFGDSVDEPRRGQESASDSGAVAPVPFGDALDDGPSREQSKERKSATTKKAPRKKRASRARKPERGDPKRDDAVSEQASEEEPKKPAAKKRRSRKKRGSGEKSEQLISREERDAIADAVRGDDDAPASRSKSSDSKDSEQAPTRKKSRRRRSSSRRKSERDDHDEPSEQNDAPEPEKASADREEDGDKPTKRRRRGTRGGRNRSRKKTGTPVAVDVIPGEDDDLPELPDLPDEASLQEGEGGRTKRKRKSRSRSRSKTETKKSDRDQGEEEEESEERGSARDSGSKKKKRRSRKRGRSSSEDDDEDEREPEEVERKSLILVNSHDHEEQRVAVIREGRIIDFDMTVDTRVSHVGDIYRGRVVNLEPAIGAAFIDFGRGRNGFLHTSDVLSAYGDKDWKLSKLLTTRVDPDEWGEDGDSDDEGEEKSEKSGSKGGRSSRSKGRSGSSKKRGSKDDDSDEDSEGDSDDDSSAKGSKRGKSDSRGKRGAKGRSANKYRARPRLPITDLLKKGQQVCVQVTKDAIGDKGPTLTTYLSIPGRYLVLMPSMARRGVSRKIEDEKERRRLKRIVDTLKAPDDMGVIVRTAGVGRLKTELKRDLEYLLGLWEGFGKKLRQGSGTAPLYIESDVAIRTIRDLYSKDTEAVIVDDKHVHGSLIEFAEELMPDAVPRIKLHDGARPLFHTHAVEQDFEKIFSRRVELPSGGSIVLDQTEALVAIDVNSGRTRTDGFDFEAIALKTNMEAVPEIARQIRLRDLGGILVLDFIDMMKRSSMQKVERAFRAELSTDRARSKMGRISQFGLLEMTRQRLGPGLDKKVFMTCPRCRGTARIRTVESRAAAILRRLGAAMTLKGFTRVEVRAHPEVVEFLEASGKAEIQELETRFAREISLHSVPDQAEDSVLRYLRADGREVRPGGRRKR